MSTEDTITIDCNYLLTPDSNTINLQLELIDNIISIFHEDFSNKIRSSIVNVLLGEELFSIKLNDLFYSLILQLSRISTDFNYTFTKESFVFDVSDVNYVMSMYFDYNIDVFSEKTNINTITECIGFALEKLSKYAWEINLLLGNTVNIYDILKLAEANSEVMDILNFSVNESSQYSEIEESITANNTRLVEILENEHTETCITNLLPVSNMGQFQQVFVNIGLKPDLYEEIIPKPINTSFLRGMRNSTDFFINAVGARKALITNAGQVRNAGYLSRKLGLLLVGTDLATDVKDCGKRSLVTTNISTNKLSSRYINRFYKDSEKDKKFKLITKENAGNLVGKDIFLASPITCNLAKENKVCRTCYGKMADLNTFHIGLTSMLILGEQFIQMLLSSKHLLRVISEYVELPGKVFSKYFEIDKNSLTATVPCKIKITDYIIDDFSNNHMINKLELYSLEGKLLEELKFDELEISLLSKFLADIDDEDVLIEVKEGDDVFRMDVQNNGLSVPLKKLLKLIESGAEMNIRATFSELVSDILELLDDSKIRLSAFGVELMVRELARNPDNLQEKSSEDGNIEFLRLTSAIIESPSASVALSFQEYNRLLEGKLFKKNMSSPLDVLF